MLEHGTDAGGRVQALVMRSFRRALAAAMGYAMIDDGAGCGDKTRLVLDMFDELTTENRVLKSMCRAAADEIDQHWESHCDEEGYGPASLMARLTGKVPPDLYPGYDA